MAGAGGRLRLRSLEGYRFAQVFAPPASDFISFEPMTAPIDPFRSECTLLAGLAAERRRKRADARLFTRNDEVEARWRIIDPMLNAWESSPDPPPPYPAGSKGPAEAERILLPGHRWRAI